LTTVDEDEEVLLGFDGAVCWIDMDWAFTGGLRIYAGGGDILFPSA
jgi:hypothetical protein